MKCIIDDTPHAALLTPCEDQPTTYISRSCVCNRFAFIGVPAGCADVLIDQRCGQDLPGMALTLERTRKTGKYDGSERDRWLWRLVSEADCAGLPSGELWISVSPEALRIRILSTGSVLTAADYARLPPVESWYDQTWCVKRNWTRYFRHLDWDTEVEPRLHEFTPLPITDGATTVSELNIHASAWLVRLSESLGWTRTLSAVSRRKGLPPWTHPDHSVQLSPITVPIGDAVACG